jgi:predicted HAD superfamily phosphohydrolase
MKLEDLIDRKILYLNYPINKYAIQEGKVAEISPTKMCIKINADWHLVSNIRIIELFSEKERPSLGFN